MKIDVIDFESVSPLRSQAIYHGIAECMSPNANPIIVLSNPSARYVCVGMHQNIDLEIDRDYCDSYNIPVIRRALGGGAVLLDEHQLFFQFIFPRMLAPRTVDTLYPYFIAPVVSTYQAIGINARFQPANDIQVDGKKIGGTGAASINQATVLAGSFLFDFDHATMANVVRAPSPIFRRCFADALPRFMTTIKNEMRNPPSRSEIIVIFLKKIEAELSCDVEIRTPTETQLHAIETQEKELCDPDWINCDGKKLVRNGIKIAANTHLTETVFNTNREIIRINVIEKKRSIVQLHLRVEIPGGDAKDIILDDAIQRAKLPSQTSEMELLQVLQSSHDFCQFDIEPPSLARAIMQGINSSYI